MVFFLLKALLSYTTMCSVLLCIALSGLNVFTRIRINIGKCTSGLNQSDALIQLLTQEIRSLIVFTVINIQYPILFLHSNTYNFRFIGKQFFLGKIFNLQLN